MRTADRRATIGKGGARQGSPTAAVMTVVALLAPVYLHGLGTVDIIGDDEAREVGIVQDIAERGHWLLPRFNNTVFPDKPVLYHWLAALSCTAGNGCDERLVRLPSAVSALALVATVGRVTAGLFDLPAGIATTVLLGLSPFLFEHARVARPDTLVTLALTAALLLFYRWWKDGCRSRVRASAIGILFGIAVLAKGPVAPVVGAGAISCFLALRRQLGRGRSLLRAHVVIPFFIIGGFWYVAALAGWGQDFARKHLIGRYLGNLLGDELAFGIQPSHSLFHHVSFYPVHLLLGTLPWTPLLVAAIVAIYRDPLRRADPRLQFLQIWIATVVVAFSFAAFKLRHYLLPALPAAAILTAPLTAALAQKVKRTSRYPGGSVPEARFAARRALPFSLAGTLLVASTIAGWWWAGGTALLSRSDRELFDTMEMVVRANPTAAMLLASAAALFCTAVIYTLLRRRWRELLGLAVAGVLTWMLTIHPSIQSAQAAHASLKPFAAAVRRSRPEGEPLYFFGPILRTVVVYVGHPIPSLRRNPTGIGPERSYVIVKEEDLPRLLQVGRPVRTVAAHVGRVGNLARGRVLLAEVGPPLPFDIDSD